ncbi:MAG: hypothetical protein WBK24_00170 [Dethiobacteria bacterium]
MNYLQSWFRRRAASLERVFFTCAAVMLSLLLVSQLLMMNEKVRSFISKVDSLEGLPYRWPAD